MSQGSLIIVAGFIMVALITVISIQGGAMDSVNNAIGMFDEMMAYNVANSGMNLCLRQVADNRLWREGYEDAALLGGALDADLVDDDMDPQVPEHGLQVTCVGTFGSATCEAAANMIRPAFCKWLYFTDYEPTIWFITGDVLDGPVHTNGTFHINGSPTFLGRVTSPNPYIGANNPNPQFLCGANLAHATIELPTDLSDLVTASQNGGRRWTTNIWLVFQADGTVEAGTSDQGPWETIDLSATNGVLYTARNFAIKGTVNGQVTVVAQRNVYVLDDVVYASDPREDPDSDDILGIIAGRNVIVKDNAPNRDDCIIHGSIMALNTSFTVQNYDRGEPRGTLHVFGGIVQKRRGPVGTFFWGQIRTGYQKDYQYDERFLTSAPPFFPRANFYEVCSWGS